MRNYDLAIFDLDGTLLNTIGDLAASCNYIMRQNNLPEHTLDEYKTFVGNGVKRLVERATPDHLRTPENIERLRREFVEYYQAHISQNTTPYNGITDVLRILSAEGVKLAVASNKFQSGTAKLINIFFNDIPFSCVFGGRDGVAPKPAPDVVSEILQVTATKPERTIYIGDSGIDIQTAKAAGVCSVGCSWGFRSVEELKDNTPDYIIDNTHQIAEIIIP